MKISFSIQGNGESCSWSLDAVFKEDIGGPVAADPHGNYFFYLKIHDDGRLYSSGTMLPVLGALPLDQYYISDVQHLLYTRDIFDHTARLWW